MRSKGAGFTLIEMLVALIISSLLAVVLFNGLNLTVRSSEAINRIQQESGRAFTIQHALRRILGGARNERVRDINGVQQVAFHGLEQEVIFVAPLTQLNDNSQLFWLKLTIEHQSDGDAQLVLKRRLYNQNPDEDIADALRSTQLDWIELSTELDLHGTFEILEHSPGAQFHFEYLSVDQANNVEWIDEWIEERDLPAMVRIHFDATDVRDWPDLIVAPKVNAHAIKTLL